MNELQIFNNERFGDLPGKEDNLFLGRVYALEYGGQIKIGSSAKLRTRIKALVRQAKYNGVEIGMVSFTDPHTNYRVNEKLMHQNLMGKRFAGTELFGISLDEAVEMLKWLSLENKSDELLSDGHERFKFLMGVIKNA